VVQLRISDELLGTAVVDEEGNWSWQGILEPGEENQVTVTAVDAEGEAQETEDQEDSPLSDSGILTSLTGMGEPGSTIQIRIGRHVLGTIEVGDDGTWAWEGKLLPGEYQVVTGIVDDSGQVVGEAPPVPLVVREAAPPQVGEVQFDEEKTATVSGRGEPGVTVEVLEDGVVIGTAEVAEDGVWSFSYQPAAGDHQVAVQNRSDPESLSASVKIAALVPEAEAIEPSPTSALTVGQAYIVQRGDTLRSIAAKFYGDRDQWRRILDATNQKARKDRSFHTIRNPNHIMRGWKIWIPPL
jgi:hypothetical protein